MNKKTSTKLAAIAAVSAMLIAQMAVFAEEDTTEEPKYDFGGRVVRIGSYYDMTPDPSKDALQAAQAERIEFVEKEYNCDIQYVDLGADYVDKYVTSVLAGDPVCEIGYVLTSTLLPSLIEGGIAYPISDLGVFDFSDYKWRLDVVDAGYYKGKNYGWMIKDSEIRFGIFWNKTLFEKYGLPNLYELVENDEWTWEKFKEVAIAGNQDVDNDGTIDIHGFACSGSLPWCYIYSNGENVAEKTEDGISIDLSGDKIMEALTALQDFSSTVTYRSEIDWSTESWDVMDTDFRDGREMMLLDGFWISYMYMDKMSDDWGWVPFPKGPSATEWSSYGNGYGGRFMLAGVENPEEVALIYDLITDVVDTKEDWDYLMEDKLDTWADDMETVDYTSYVYNNNLSVIDVTDGFPELYSAVSSMFDEITSGTMTPQTALETYQSQIDAAIADLKNHDYKADMEQYLEEEITEGMD